MKRLLLVLTILISCVGCDQTTKSVAKIHLSKTHAISLLGDSIRLQLAENSGAFLSAGASLPLEWRSRLFTMGAGLVLSGLLAYALLSKKSNPVVIAGTALIVGGGVSNLIDRLAYDGHVIDFLNVGIGSLRTGIFNWADVCIMAGVGLWLFGDWVWKSTLSNKTATE